MDPAIVDVAEQARLNVAREALSYTLWRLHLFRR
jgi:hypothetical protein